MVRGNLCWTYRFNRELLNIVRGENDYLEVGVK